MRAKPCRGLHDIITRSDLGSQTDNAQRKYLQVACLELRKTLCRKVRDAARTRAAEMDRKIAELEGETSRILAAQQIVEPAQTQPIPARHSACRQRSAARPGFTLKY
jgi:hypothetical protein